MAQHNVSPRVQMSCCESSGVLIIMRPWGNENAPIAKSKVGPGPPRPHLRADPWTDGPLGPVPLRYRMSLGAFQGPQRCPRIQTPEFSRRDVLDPLTVLQCNYTQAR